MGSVYEVEHRELGKRFVLKALLREFVGRNDLVQRLRNEWRALGKLEHPNIVSVSDAGIATNGVPYYVMERLQGETLGARLRTAGRLPLTEAIAIATALLDGLSAAHAIGVVHRDIKPPNIYLTAASGVKILDFGIAKLLDTSSPITSRGYAIGTPRYMSPEQASGGKVDGRADLYAVGLLLFEMLAGQSPFEKFPADQMFRAHVMEPPPALTQLVPRIPSELDHLVARLLEKDPQKRPRSAEGAATTLRAILRSVHGGVDTLSAPLSDALTPMVRAALTGERASNPGSGARVSVHPGVNELGPTQSSQGLSSAQGVLAEGQTLSSTLRLSPAVRAELQQDPDLLLSATRTSVPAPRGGVTPVPVASSPAPPSLTPISFPPATGRRFSAGLGAGLFGSALAVFGAWALASGGQATSMETSLAEAAPEATQRLANDDARPSRFGEASATAEASAAGGTERAETQPPVSDEQAGSGPQPVRLPEAVAAALEPAAATTSASTSALPNGAPGVLPEMASARSRSAAAPDAALVRHSEAAAGAGSSPARGVSVAEGASAVDADQPPTNAPAEGAEGVEAAESPRSSARGPAANPWSDEPPRSRPRSGAESTEKPATDKATDKPAPAPRRDATTFGRRLPGSGLPGL